MKSLKYLTAIAFLCAALPAQAQVLKGAELVAAVNGQSFECKSSRGGFSWKFAKSSAKGTTFPYVAKFGGRTVKQAYKLTKKGTFRHAGTNGSRQIKLMKDGSYRVTGSGVPAASCIRK